MGKKLTGRKLNFVSFEPTDGEFVAFTSVEWILSGENDPEPVLRKAGELYGHSIVRMRRLLSQIQSVRADGRLMPARKMWELGQVIFDLKRRVEKLSLQISGLYDHLSRDLGVKREWLQKVIIFRRYLPDKALIPDGLNWGRCARTPRSAAETLGKKSTGFCQLAPGPTSGSIPARRRRLRST
jgi:hypothetical protein